MSDPQIRGLYDAGSYEIGPNDGMRCTIAARLTASVQTIPHFYLTVDCDTGKPLGPTVKATHTATFVAWKRGFLEPEAKNWTGEVHVIDIGAPKKLMDEFRAPRG